MKLFLSAVLMMMVIKGVSYIIAPQFMKNCASKFEDATNIQIITYGWILVFCASAAWLGFVRYMAD